VIKTKKKFHFFFDLNKKMQKQLVFLSLLFLVCTADLQNIASSTTIGSQNNTNTPLSLETLKTCYSRLQDYYSNLKSKFDPNGDIDVIVKYFASPRLHDQALIQDDMDTSNLAMSDKVYIIGTVIFALSTVFDIIPVGEYVNKLTSQISTSTKNSVKIPLVREFPKVRSTFVNIGYLVASSLWFESFMLAADSFLDAPQDYTSAYPLLLKLLGGAFLTLRPMTSLLKFKAEGKHENPAELVWGDYFGLLFFHIGNMAQLAFFPQKLYSSLPRQSYYTNFRLAALVCTTVGSGCLLATNPRVVDATKLSPLKQQILSGLGVLLLVTGSALVFIN